MVRKWKVGATSPSISDELLDPSGSGLDLSSATAVRFVMGPIIGGTTVNADGTIVPPSSVRYDWGTADLVSAGMYRAYWEIDYSDGSVEKLPQGGAFPGDPDFLLIHVTEAI